MGGELILSNPAHQVLETEGNGWDNINRPNICSVLLIVRPDVSLPSVSWSGLKDDKKERVEQI